MTSSRRAKLFLGLAVFAALGFFLFASRSYQVRISPAENLPSKPERITIYPFLQKALGGEALLADDEPVAVLLAGIPGAGNPAPNLTDTVMVVYLEPRREAVTLFSLPRDLIVQIPGANYYARLNSVYERGEALGSDRGIELLRKAVEEVTGLATARYAIVDLSLVRDTVDALGGLNVLVEKDVLDPFFPGPAFSYQTFTLEKGWRYLDGETATKFIRTRFGPEGDFGRMRRQQQLIEAAKQKAAGFSLIWDLPTFLHLYESFNAHVRTDFSSEELVAIFEFGKKLHPDNIRTVLLDADPEKKLLTTGDFWFGSERASIVKPVTGIGQYANIHAYVQEILR